jgi:serine/threonine protein kinase
VRVLGKGGMGTVWLAEDTERGGEVALKMLNTREDAWDMVLRLQREARAAASASTEHVVQVLDAGIDGPGGRPYVAMELLEGWDVSVLVDRVGALPESLALRIVAQACRGIQSAHRAGVVHRDIKPANLFLTRIEDIFVVKVLDFGAAKMSHDLGPSLTIPGTVIGSPRYMAPEQAGAGDVDHRADIWSLGAVLYKLLSGASPFEGARSAGELLFKLFSEEVPPLASRVPCLPWPIIEAVHRALEREPERRHPSALDLSSELTRLAGGTVIWAKEIDALGTTIRCAPPDP